MSSTFLPFTSFGFVEFALEYGEETTDPVVQSDVHDELEDVDDLQLRVHHQIVLLQKKIFILSLK